MLSFGMIKTCLLLFNWLKEFAYNITSGSVLKSFVPLANSIQAIELVGQMVFVHARLVSSIITKTYA